MDVNPYQSPQEQSKEEESDSASEASQASVDRTDLLIFGAMTGSRIYATAGLLMAFCNGLIALWHESNPTVVTFLEAVLHVILPLGLLGALSGALLGSLNAAVNGLMTRSRFNRGAAWLIWQGLHVGVGIWIAHAIRLVDVIHDSYFSLPVFDFRLQSDIAIPLLIGIALGLLLGQLLDRRIRRTLDTLAAEDTQATSPQ